MGTGKCAKKKGLHAKKKEYKRGHDTKRRGRDLDQIQDDLRKTSETGRPMTFGFDDDLPGGGQFYCVETGQHFIDLGALNAHKKSRFYRRRLKEIKEEQYTQRLSEMASGKTVERLPPAHPELANKKRIGARAAEAAASGFAAAAAAEDREVTMAT